ncbi:MAG: hypothetical protein Kow0025_13100 [Thermodesulfovibrionales bacterium]
MKQVVKIRDDIAFYIVLYPILDLHPDAYDKARAIACQASDDKALAMLEDAFAGKALPAPTCDTKEIDENIQLASKLGINATPAIVFENGRKVLGAMKAGQLIGLADEAAGKAQSFHGGAPK